MWDPALLPIKPDQLTYYKYGLELNLPSLKSDLRLIDPEIKFHYGMWYLSTFIQQFSFFGALSLRLLNCLVLLLNVLFVIKIAKKWSNEFVAEKIGLLFLCVPSFFVFSQLYLKDLYIAFTMTLILFFAADLKWKNLYLMIIALFMQYHFRIPMMPVAVLIVLNTLLVKMIKNRRIWAVIFFAEFAALFMIPIFKNLLPLQASLLVGAIDHISKPSNLFHFSYSYLIETLGLSFLIRPPQELDYSLIKVILGRLVVLDSLIIPVLMFYYLVRQTLRRNYQWLLIVLLPSILYYLVYYYNYEVLGNNALYSFRVSLPMHLMYIVFVLISYFNLKNENNIRSR
jgi:hypothetical protein